MQRFFERFIETNEPYPLFEMIEDSWEWYSTIDDAFVGIYEY